MANPSTAKQQAICVSNKPLRKKKKLSFFIVVTAYVVVCEQTTQGCFYTGVLYWYVHIEHLSYNRMVYDVLDYAS